MVTSASNSAAGARNLAHEIREARLGEPKSDLGKFGAAPSFGQVAKVGRDGDEEVVVDSPELPKRRSKQAGSHDLHSTDL